MFEVNLFGKFRMSNEEKTVSQDEIHSEMIIKLLSYILIYRERLVTVDELTEVFWAEEETVNPGGALKNLMYRMRNVLKQCFGEGDYILNIRGAYYWNKRYDVVLDCEQFEESYKKADRVKTEQDKKRCYEKVIDLYRGDLLSRYCTLQWIIPLSTYYHSAFLTAVKKLTAIYQKEKDYENIERISTFALQLDHVDEMLHCQLIRSLIYQNKQELANEYFKRAEKMLNSALGISKSDGLHEVQTELIRMQTIFEEAQLEDVSVKIAENQDPDGAYICSYPIFREIYRLECRRAARLGDDVEYILLLTVSLRKEARSENNEQYNQYQMNRAMENLLVILKESLRISDVVAKYSNSQYIVLLPLLGYEDCIAVAKRISKGLYSKVNSKKIQIKSDISSIGGNSLEKGCLEFMIQ